MSNDVIYAVHNGSKRERATASAGGYSIFVFFEDREDCVRIQKRYGFFLNDALREFRYHAPRCRRSLVRNADVREQVVDKCAIFVVQIESITDGWITRIGCRVCSPRFNLNDRALHRDGEALIEVWILVIAGQNENPVIGLELPVCTQTSLGRYARVAAEISKVLCCDRDKHITRRIPQTH